MGATVIYRFASYEFDPQAGELRRAGLRLHVQGKPLQLLALLLERAPQVVSRAEMRERLWAADTFVDFDHNLNAAVKTLRHALDDSAGVPRFIATISRRGYRFLAPVETIAQHEEARGAAPSSPPPFPIGPSPRGPWASRALLVAVVLAALLTTSFHPAAPPPSPAEDCPTRFTLAVLPFQHQSTEKRHRDDDHRWTDGLTETVRLRLARWNPGRLGVISHRSAEHYRCTSKTVADIGRELGVAFVVDGRVSRRGDRVRITAEFVQVSDQTQIWSDSFELPAADAAIAEEVLTRKLLNAVELCLSPSPPPREVASHIARVAQE